MSLRWGILATGWISNKFSLDLLIHPETRQVKDVSHVIQAVASRSTEKATEFIDALWKEAGAAEDLKADVAAYGTYEELFKDPKVDCVYVGSPHSHHYRHVHAALSAGKNVLCEKSLVVNGDQAQTLVDLARKNKVFFMEAVWLRFQPVAYKVQELIKSGTIGEIRSVQSELCVDFQEYKADPAHRMIAPDLAGGALLDLGPYAWTWLALTLLTPSKASVEPITLPKIAGSIIKTATGVDAHTVATIQFPQQDGRIVHGTMSCSVSVATNPARTVIVHGSKGFLEVHWPTYRPTSISYTAWDTDDGMASVGGDSPQKPSKSELFSFEPRPGNAWGFVWEADEVARCIKAKKLESDRMPLNETVLMMRVFDKIRKDGELVYPEAIETLELA